ncbi:MAG: hypothetical protein ACK5NK_16075 [Niabella sp.]
MKRNLHIILAILFSVINILSYATPPKEKLIIALASNAPSRIQFGAEHLQKQLSALGYQVSISAKTNIKKSRKLKRITISIGNANSKKEGFIIDAKGNDISVMGTDASGALYGCLELAEQANILKKLPENFRWEDAPEMVLRGECIGVQKPYYLPGRNVYEYPYTPETFPWFYDKKLWIQVLDSMMQNRMNSLYLWNGHPFASLVKLKEYPYAVEVDDTTFAKNEDMYRFLTTEADKRGIWVIQMFYNILISKPFAEKNGFKTQERERPIIPVIADYTRKSIAAFVEKYPNVGLLVTLGEAMEGVGKDDIEWFTKTIIPGVQDGLKALNKAQEPPIVLRAHDTDAPAVMKAALPLYKNLYTMAKFNGEALTYERPRGKWAELHQTLSSQGNVHVANVHILANLEPFRYAAANFIQRSVKGMHEVLGANALHLYPEASYWDWPYTADSVQNGQRLLQIERDWLWYKMWSRYAWKADRDRNAENNYWGKELAVQFGTDLAAGKNILEAYEQAGEIAPKLLRRFGITDGNRQTLTLGMLMTQLINPYRYGLFTLLYEAEAPEGESLAEYAEKEWQGKTHQGETPPIVIKQVKEHGDKAVAAIDAASSFITQNKAAFDRVKNDVYAYRALAYHFANKADAALYVLRYKYSNDLKDLDKALVLLQQSVNDYKELVRLTKGTYLYANSMQTQQRKIPLRGVDATYKNWYEVLVPFEQELNIFSHKLDSLKSNSSSTLQQITALKNAKVTRNGNHQLFVMDSLSALFSDTSFFVRSFATELKGLKGIRLSFHNQIQNGTQISFNNAKPVKILVGFFEPQKAAFTKDTVFLKAPELETNALANDYGQADRRIANAIVIPGMPQLHIHAYDFKAGVNTLKLEKGVALILGFIDADAPLKTHDAGLYETGNRKIVDWLFE